MDAFTQIYKPAKQPSVPSSQTLRWLAILLFTAPVALHALLSVTPFATSSLLVTPEISAAQNALVVVAHPDDEALFFSPTLTTLRERGTTTHVLVISSGDYYGKGAIRRMELQGSCSALGVSSEHCVVLDEDDLRDAPRQWWSTRRIEDIVLDYVSRWQIDLVVTFDDTGISGHLNHRATSLAVTSLAARNVTFPPTYQLWAPHYKRFGGASLFEIFPAAAPVLARSLIGSQSSQALMVSTYQGYLDGRAAFGAHASQGGWDSWLWRSRYMFVNRLIKVQPVSAVRSRRTRRPAYSPPALLAPPAAEQTA